MWLIFQCTYINYNIELTSVWVFISLDILGEEDKSILSDVSGRFRPYYLSAILGPSGAGKTTLLNILTGRR